MDVLVTGFVLGVGATWLARRRSLKIRGAVAWTARQAGLISGQVSARLAEARRVGREQYEKGRAIAAASGDSARSTRDAHPGSEGTVSRNGALASDHRSSPEEHHGSPG
jgi:hypothetical protein